MVLFYSIDNSFDDMVRLTLGTGPVPYLIRITSSNELSILLTKKAVPNIRHDRNDH